MKFRIHGDNILECERALELVALSLETKPKYIDSPIYAPIYNLMKKDQILGQVQLFPGYDKWGINIQEILKNKGAPLREATDAIVTLQIENNEEEIIFSIEFCNALPAGNNAWQRTGRALASASVNVPYLHISEIGGVELDKNRKIKAHRFPNPIVPLSYITLGKNYDSLTIPVYLPSPSSPKELRETFKNTFGIEECINLIKGIILKKDIKENIKILVRKNLELIKLLSSNRKRNDTLSNNQWQEFFDLSAKDRLRWLENKKFGWTKKSSEKVSTTKTFKKLLAMIKEMNSLSVGAGDIPICLIPSNSRRKLSENIRKLYGSKIQDSFLKWLNKNTAPLIIVWITGFKPRGDDSRPDRGLVPLARMLLGPDIEILSIIYGPAKSKMWQQLNKSPRELAKQNGLWEAIINLSDGILADSSTYTNSPLSFLLDRNKTISREKIKFKEAVIINKFSEQDVDSVIHFVFAHSPFDFIFESMCNPPGGDWSGLSFKDFNSGNQFRWTSLPRVSKTNGKRPDHVIEIKSNNKILLLSIESKDNSNDLDKDIGRRLSRYTSDLIKTAPTVKKTNSSNWELMTGRWSLPKELVYISGGAFCYKNKEELELIMKKCSLDVVFAIEFLKNGNVILHVKLNQKASDLVKILKEIEKLLKNRLEIKIY
jgi:hypothetical protein